MIRRLRQYRGLLFSVGNIDILTTSRKMKYFDIYNRKFRNVHRSIGKIVKKKIKNNTIRTPFYLYKDVTIETGRMYMRVLVGTHT